MGARATKKKAGGKKAVAKKTAGKKAPATKVPTSKTRGPRASKVRTTGSGAKTAKKKVAKKKAATKTAGRVRKGRAARPVRPTPAKLAALRSKLLEKERELLQTSAAYSDDTRDRLDDGTEDYIDYAVSSYAKEFLLSLTEMDRKHLRLVEEAIRRIDRREYGACLNCGQEIPILRLEVQPWAQYCVRCQELEERGLLEGRSMGAGDFDEADEDEEESLDDEADTEEDEAEEDESDSDDEELDGDEPVVLDGDED